MKKLFKKQGVIDTTLALLVGGAGNAAMDMVVENVDALKSLNPLYINLIKIGVGVAGGSMTTNKTIHQATDGVAVVGASDIVKSIIDGTFSFGGDEEQKTPSGLPAGTIGRLRAGNRRFMTRHKVSGVDSIMSC